VADDAQVCEGFVAGTFGHSVQALTGGSPVTPSAWVSPRLIADAAAIDEALRAKTDHEVRRLPVIDSHDAGRWDVHGTGVRAAPSG
jgi:hypothetical protein